MGQHPDVNGVSSDWEFDARFHCAPLSTTYRLWQLRDGKYGTISYVSANGKDGSLSNFDIWNLETPKITDIHDAEDIVYPTLKDNYAVVVAASTGWSNYRHQADALAMYQLLKRYGNSGTLYMNETKFPAAGVNRMLRTMNSEGKYRRMFFVIEACYSGSVAKVCEGIPGVLFLTAANMSETSKADIIDKKLKTYLSNGFTRGFQQRIDSEPSVTLRDLYYHVAAQTVGSHARMYNIPAFGSVYKTSMSEFLRK